MSDNKEVYIDREAVAKVDAKIKESKAMTSGMISSWNNPIEGITKGPNGAPITKAKTETVDVGFPSVQETIKKNGLIIIPFQAMKQFKALLGYIEMLEVKLTQDQARMFLDSLSEMPTPKKMTDAKAVITLISSLEMLIS